MRNAICFLLGLLASSSCAAPQVLRYQSAAFQPATQPALCYASPLSIVKFLVGDQQQARPDWFLSAMVARVLKKALLVHRAPLHLTTELVIDSVQRPALSFEISRAVNQLALKKSIDSLQLPLLAQAVRRQPQRYTLVMLYQGFTRAVDSYARASMRGSRSMALYGVGSMPIKAMSALCVLVYDSQTQRIVYVRESVEGHEPLDAERMGRHLQRLVGADFSFTAK